MTIVSISEAARLTGKARSTIQAYIKTGKLSKTTGTAGSQGIDTSELLRVFGELFTTDTTCSESVVISQQTTPDTTGTTAAELAAAKAENDSLKALLAAKQETIDSLNRALLLLEHKQEEKTGEQPTEEPKKSLWKRLFS